MWLLWTLLIVGWIIAVVEFAILRWPTKLPPVTEKGHRGYEVHSYEEREALIRVLALGGLKSAMRFKIGPTDQTLMDDGYTVVNLHTHSYNDPAAKFSGTFISLVNDQPEDAGRSAIEILRALDPATEWSHLPIGNKRPLVPVFSPKLGITITFRQHAMKLGKPPGQIPV